MSETLEVETLPDGTNVFEGPNGDYVLGNNVTPDKFVQYDSRRHWANVCRAIAEGLTTVAAMQEASIAIKKPLPSPYHEKLRLIGDEAFLEIYPRLRWLIDAYESTYCLDEFPLYTDPEWFNAIQFYGRRRAARNIRPVTTLWRLPPWWMNLKTLADTPAPQKMEPAAMMKAIDEVKAEKKPQRAKAAGAKKSTKKHASTANEENGQSQVPSDAKLFEIMKEQAKTAPNILGGKPSLNPRMSSRFRIDPKTTTVGTKREIKVLPVRPPNKYEHVRVHPDIHADVMILKPQDSKETYVVDVSMHDPLRRWITPATLRLAITSDGSDIVWPLRFSDEGNKDYAAWTSARGIAEDAETEWCSLIWNAGQMAYDKGTADIEFGEPTWNEFTFEPDAIDLMFEKMKDNFIEDMSHPMVRKLGLKATTAAEEAERKAYEKQRKAAEAAVEAEEAEAAAKAAKAAADKAAKAKAAKVAKKNGQS